MKRQIRNGVFETNSSSTHSLSMTNEHIDDTEFDNSVFEKEYIIKSFSESEVDEFMEISSVTDKLRYFLTLYHQSFNKECLPESFMRLLKKIFPNTIFSAEFETMYIFEDGEYFFDSYYDSAECKNLMDEYMLKKFMLYGTINFGNRNSEEYMDEIDSIRYDKNLWSIDWSG